MRTLTNLILLSLAFLSPLAASTSEGLYELSEFDSVYQYTVPSYDIKDIVRASDENWIPLKGGNIQFLDKTLWIKIPLNELGDLDEFFITEHKGLKAWEYYLITEGTVLMAGDIDWGRPHGFEPQEAISYRSFSFVSLSGHSHSGSVLYLKLKPRYTQNFRFILRNEDNFILTLQNWTMVQGLGLGSLLILVLLSFLLAFRMHYKVSSYFLILTLFSGVNILFISGFGPYFNSWLFPALPHIVWYILISLFSSVTILYIQSFLELAKWGRSVQIYFRALLILSFFLALLIPLFPVESLFLFLNFQSMLIYSAIVAGLIYLVSKGSVSARWLLVGLLLYYLITSMGYILSSLNTSRVFMTSLSFYLGQGFFILFFGGGLIVEIEEKRQQEKKKRIEAEYASRGTLERLTENERMAELGRLVSSVTHELGTPLGVGVTLSTSINNSATRLLKSYKEGELSEDEFHDFMIDVQESSDLIYHNMLMVRSLIKGFKEIAADQASPDIRDIKLKEYTDKIIKVLSPGYKNRSIVFESTIDTELSIKSIPGILTQVLNNLINNAVLHGLEDLPQGKVYLESEEQEESVIISVGDTGKGMSPDIQQQIFDIYFTTKKGNGGTGVGLPIVHSLVEEKLKGSLSFQSTVGEGTVFTVTLPKDINKT